MLFSGVANIDLWYPFPFFFPTAHYWMAWVTIGALIVHIGAKLSVTRRALRRPINGTGPVDDTVDPLARRRFLTVVGAGAGLLTVATVGQTIAPLQQLAVLAPRHPDTGTQGFPVNKTAAEANVIEAAQSPDYRLSVGSTTFASVTALSFSVDDLRRLTQHEATLPIACVEGWSVSKRWRGVLLRDLLEQAGAPTDAQVTVSGLEQGGRYGQSDLDADQAWAANTLLAMEVDGQALALDHGYPLRLIAPNRPGVMQTKWITRVEIR